MKNKLFWVFAVSLSAISNVQAQKGQDRGSGNLSGIRSGYERYDQVIEELGSGEITKAAAELVDWLNDLPLDYTPEHAQMKALGAALKEDILESKIKFEKECLVDGEPQSFSTIKGKSKADICVDAKRLIQEMKKLKIMGTVASYNSDVIGLLIHEAVRHFGIEDMTPGGRHPIAYFVQESYGRIRHYRWQLKTFKEPLTSSIWVFSKEKSTIPDPVLHAENSVQSVEMMFRPTQSNEEACYRIPIQVTVQSEDDSGKSRKLVVSSNGQPFSVKVRDTFDPMIDITLNPLIDPSVKVSWDGTSEKLRLFEKLNEKCVLRPFIRADGEFKIIPEYLMYDWETAMSIALSEENGSFSNRPSGRPKNINRFIKLQRIPFETVP